MTNPISIFKATFLHYESSKEPTEMMAKAIMYKKKNENATSVLIGLFSRGFYIKGVLNHISGDDKKLRKNQFVSVGLLKNVFKLQFKTEFVLWVFHETVELKTEALLFLFRNNSDKRCNHFFEYLKKLISDKYCSGSDLESFCVAHDCQSTRSTMRSSSSKFNSPRSVRKSNISKRRIVHPMSNQIDHYDHIYNSLEEKENRQGFIIYNDEEALHFSGFSRNPRAGGDDIGESSENESILSLNSAMIRNYIHVDNEALKIIMKNRVEKTDSECDYNIASDTETDQSIDSSFWKSNPNEYNQILDQLECIKTNQYLDLSNFSFNNYFGDESEKSEENNLNDINVFCWPEYLVPELRFKSSMLVEMTFTTNNLTSNWGYWDKFIGTTPLSGILPELVWDEKIDRLHYDPIRKKFESDDDGCLLIYCCRQKPKIDDIDSYYEDIFF